MRIEVSTNMRISIVPLALLATTVMALSGCGGGSDSSSSGDNFAPLITGTPPTALQAGTSYTFQPQAADPDGDALSFSAINLPAWLTIDATTGKVTGTPTEANVGMTGMITIEVSDSKVATDLPAFRIEVTSAVTVPPPADQHPPIISGTPGTTATVGAAYTFTPVASDADNDPLQFSITNKPSWATFTPATGQLSGTPASGNVGSTSDIVISVSDGNQSAALAAFSIQVVTTAPTNRAPTITGTPATTATVGRAYQFRPVGSDPDGNNLQYSIQGKPNWATFSMTTGRLAGTPMPGDVGASGNITISVSDGSLTTALPAFTIMVAAAANAPPTISGNPLTSILAGANYSFTPTASDPEGATLTFSITNKPDWATFSTTTGALTGMPITINVGSTNGIVISVTDGTTQVSLPSFNLTVASVATGNATLNWTAPTMNSDGTPLTNLAGYRIAYGRSSTNLDQTVSINNSGTTTHTLNNLTAGTWYFTMYSFTSDGIESDPGALGQKTIQ
jgi:hypothetical protein